MEGVSINASLVGEVIVATGLLTAVVNCPIAFRLSEKISRAFIYGVGMGLMVSPSPPFFTLIRFLRLYRNKTPRQSH